MRKTIIGTPGCSKCKMLSMQCPDAEHKEIQPSELLAFARAVGIQSMPFVLVTGEPDELTKVLKGE